MRTLVRLSAAVPALVLCAAGARDAAQDVYRKVHPSVVCLRNLEGSATGVIIDAAGLILTNAHAVISPLPFECQVDFGAGTTKKTVTFKKVTIVGVHPKCDLALVKIDPAEHPAVLPAATMSRTKGEPGQRVFVIGNPVVGEGMVLTKSITEGMLSGVDRVIDGLPYYQISAQINPGNSGGPMCDASGNVLGLVTFKIDEREGIGFAVPLDEFNAKAFVPLAERTADPAAAQQLCAKAREYEARASALYRANPTAKEGAAYEQMMLLRYFALRCYSYALICSPRDDAIFLSVGYLYRHFDEDRLAAAYIMRSIELNPWARADGRQYFYCNGFPALRQG